MTGHPRAERRRTRAGARSRLLAVLLLLAAPSLAGAQTDGTARIVGRIVEAGSGRSVVGAALRLEGTERTAESDRQGRFSFDAVLLGTYLLSIEHLAYEPVEDSIHLEEAGATYDAEVQLSADAIELPPMLVTIRRPPGILDDVYERMDWMSRVGLGDMFDRRTIETSGATRVSHLLAVLPGARLRPVPGRAGTTTLRLSARNDCPPSYYIDGMRAQIGDESVDDFVAMGDVEAVEVYRRLSSLPGQFADEQALYCGAVAIWTRRGIDDGEQFGWRRMLTMTGFVGLSYLIMHLWF